MAKFRDIPAPHYIVLKERDMNDLVNRVNEYLEHGYLPVGGVCVLGTQGSAYLDFYQAVFKPCT